jgi:hypothetical protein
MPADTVPRPNSAVSAARSHVGSPTRTHCAHCAYIYSTEHSGSGRRACLRRVGRMGKTCVEAREIEVGLGFGEVLTQALSSWLCSTGSGPIDGWCDAAGRHKDGLTTSRQCHARQARGGLGGGQGPPGLSDGRPRGPFTRSVVALRTILAGWLSMYA